MDRYEQYKDSGIHWLGYIPIHWQVCKIKRLCNSVYAGGTPSSNQPKYWNGNIPWIPSGCCHDCNVDSAPAYITQLGYNNSSTKYIPANTAIMAMTGATCSQVGYLTFKACANQSVVAYNVNKSKLHSRFVFYLLQSMRGYILTFQTGGAQGGINVNDCRNLIIPHIPLDEQEAIAAYLDSEVSKIDEAIKQQQKMIELLNERRQIIISEAVTKGLNPDVKKANNNVEEIGLIPEHWLLRKFKRVAKVQANLVSPKRYSDLPQVAPENIEKGTGKLLEYTTVSESGVISDNHLFHAGQIIYSKIRPSLNKLIIAPFDGLCSADMYPITTSMNVRFLYYYMLSKHFVSQVNKVVMDRVKMPKINKEELSLIYVPVPPVNEQEEIINYLDNRLEYLDKAISKCRNTTNMLSERKRIIINDVVTGKVRVS